MTGFPWREHRTLAEVEETRRLRGLQAYGLANGHVPALGLKYSVRLAELAAKERAFNPAPRGPENAA